MSTDNNSTQALVVAVGQLRLVNYIRAASLALLAYDISIMFGLESKMVLAKVIIPSGQILCIYISSLGIFSASIVAGTIVNAILTLRLNALYGNKKIVLIWLLAILICMVLVCAVTAVTLDGPLVIVATPALHAGYSLAVSRLIINLRCTALGQNASATWAETVSFQVLEPSNSSDSIGILLETLYYGHNDT
ncbi:hypothetical protein WG66_014422 [Moniliophthora roreri]|nr:hypothetical protein WG66_014422 [Moniliophthora roreri]